MIKLRMKELFFDRQVVIRAMDAASLKALSKGGAFVRRRAKSSIRPARMKRLAEMTREEARAYRIQQQIAKRAGRKPPKRPLVPSRPGQPPRSRTGLLKNFLYFAYDLSTKSVVVGPERLSRSTGAPQTLEHGGTTKVTNLEWRGDHFVRLTERKFIRPRPYMGPALEQEAPKLDDLWRNSIRG